MTPNTDDFVSLQIIAPIDLGDSWIESSAWKKVRKLLSAKSWSSFVFSEQLELDLSFYDYYKWLKKDLSGIDCINRYLSSNIPGISSISKCDIILCNNGISLLKCTYTLNNAVSPDKAQQIYMRLSSTHYKQLYQAAFQHLSSHDFNEISQINENSIYSRSLIYMQKQIPHWTHGIFAHFNNTDKQYSGQDLKKFTLVDNIFSYIVDDVKTVCSFGWEMTAFSTSGPSTSDEIKKLIWISCFIWEELYVFEHLTVDKVNNLEKGLQGIKSKLKRARRFRTVVTTVIASTEPANVTMTDRYIKILDVIVDQWRIAERKDSLIGKIGLLELMYSNMKDEETEYNANLFNIYLLILTIVTVVDSLGNVMHLLFKGSLVHSYTNYYWLTSVVLLLLTLFLLSKYYRNLIIGK